MNYDKKSIRNFIINIRNNHEYKTLLKESSAKINFNIINNFKLLDYNNFFIYISNIYEINTYFLIKMLLNNKKKVSVPYVYNKTIMLSLEINKKTLFFKNKFEIYEPYFDFKNIVISKYECIIIPCLCADKLGYRIGYGRGYYDRFLLKNSKSQKIILCPNKFLFDTINPELFDIKCNYIITEDNILKVK